MMDHPLTVRTIYERSAPCSRTALVTRRPGPDGWGVRRTSLRRLGRAGGPAGRGLRELGVGPGDRVATFCWNHDRHLEVYFAAALMGASYHPQHPPGRRPARLHRQPRPRQGAGLRRRAGPGDRAGARRPRHRRARAGAGRRRRGAAVARLRRRARLRGAGRALGPDDRLAGPGRGPDGGICYTSATTGNPKGVAYSHRALYLHSLVVGLVDTAAISERDVLLPIVPMFHVNAWGMPFAATWYGAGQVYGGPAPTPADYLRLIREEGVTVSAGVPTVWLGILQLLEQDGGDLGPLQRIICGGSAAPVSMIRAYEERHGVQFVHAYGMTEATPVTILAAQVDHGRPADRGPLRLQGQAGPARPRPGAAGGGRRRAEVPADGKSMGEPSCAAPPSPRSTWTTRARPRPSSTAGTTPATWPPSTTTATCTWSTGPRTWSSRAASGSPASSWRTPSWATPRSPRRR